MDRLLEAINRFRSLFEQAKQADLREPSAMTLATADHKGRPSARTVLLKVIDERGFVFFTNINSRKGRQLADNPYAALCFFWQPLMQQVTVEGKVEALRDGEADAYWATRPRTSQLGAWASRQSEPLNDRETLERRYAELDEQFSDRLVPRPPHWSGFRIIPERIEFWRSQPHRLHERVCYRKQDDEWDVTLLNP